MKTKADIFFDEQTHTYLVDGKEVPSVTEILKPLSNRAYGKVNQATLDYAAARGTAVHEACEAVDLGFVPDLDYETQPFIQAYADWCEVYSPMWIGVEQIVFCEPMWYAGTLDRFGILNDGEYAIVDLKTSSPTKEAYVSVCLQTAAYAVALLDDDALPKDIKACDIKRYGLFLKKDGKYRMLDCSEYEGANHFDSFKAFCHLRATDKLINKLLKGDKQNG